MGLATCIFDVNHKLSQPLARWHRQAILLANISIYISQGSIFVALSTSIASIIRLTHTPPLHEQYFLQSLNAYQFFVSVGAMIPLCSMSGYHERKLTALRLFGAAACLLSFYASETEFSPRLNAQSISQFNASCLDNPMTDGSQGSKQVWSPELTVIIVIALGWFVWTVINIIFGHTFRRASDRVDSAIQHYLHITPDDVVISIVISLLIMSWIKWCYYFIQILQGQRRKAQSFSGEAYEDSKWGFGQVTIMLLWAPLINDIVLEIIGEIVLDCTRLCRQLMKTLDPEYFWPQSGSDQVEVALNRSVEETMRLSDEEHHIENSVALFDDRPYEDIEETSSIPLNDGGQFHDLESTSPLINDNAVNHDDAFQMEAEANSPFRFSFAEGGEPTTTSTEIVNDSPTNPQVKQRTWPRNEDGTYLPNRISKALLK